MRYLKWNQIFFRVYRKLKKPKVTEIFDGSIFKPSKTWEHFLLHENKINNQLEACFLNYSKKLDLPYDWNNKDLSKLWVYNLHYFEDLLSLNAQEKHNLHLNLLHDWVDQNPVGYGNGWEPYPSSLRIVNVIKAWLGGLRLDKKIFTSIHVQSSFLSNNLEKHLLGNHYFVNLKALLYAGVVFKNKQWLDKAQKGLFSEISEQVLDDGANFELSPMYHSLMLVDMLDIYNLSKAYPNQVSNRLASLLEAYIPKMLIFMETMSHPDGGVSFFNDSADKIAPIKSKIENYAEKLGFKISPLNLAISQIIDNDKSGYVCATLNGNKLIFDASAVGPEYIPGHAHADTLSFELSIGAQRVFVNSGTSEYGTSSKRLNQRKTASHNTVEVDGKDSSQVWSSFRVAKRAKILKKHIAKNNHKIEMMASHDGYRSLCSKCIHSRKLTFGADYLVVSDELQNKFKFAKSRFYFHPDLIITLKDDLLRIKGEEFTLHSNLQGKKASLVDSLWYPEFGIEVPNKMLLLNFVGNQLDIEFSWSKN